MRKFCIKVLLFVALCIVVDVAMGVLGKYLVSHAKSGMTEKNEYICNRTKEDILIFGSSRAVHHYDPIVLEDSLKLSCYNCAYDGCGSITAYGLLNIILQHYTPKIVLYDIAPGFDYLKNETDNTKFLGPLKMYYDYEGIDSIFLKAGKTEKYKMKSQMYRMNSKLILMLTENTMKRNETINGYLPKKESLKHKIEKQKDPENTNLEYDSMKIDCLNRIISLCKQKKIKLVFYASPAYMRINDTKFDYIKKLSKLHNIPFFNHYCDSIFTKNSEYFYDSMHMNQTGAKEYSKFIIPELKYFLTQSK